MTSITTTTSDRDKTFDNILTSLKFAITLTSAIIYGVEKLKRVGEIIKEEAGITRDPIANATSVITFLSNLFNYISYAIAIVEFFDPLFREESTLLGIKFKKDSYITRRIFSIIVFTITGAVVATLAYLYWDKIKSHKKWLSEKKDAYKAPISWVSNGFIFIGGIVQLIALIQNWDNYKNRKLFSISAVILSLSAPFEIYKVDNYLYKAEKRGLVYIGVYGTRTVVKITQAVGLLTKD
ncbi:MAG: hypothetical protein ACXVJB_02500 [Mucilaginibacter sp.]